MPAAIRFGRAATNSSLSRTADLPPIGSFTAMGWFRVNANQTGSFFVYGSAATLENAIIYYQPTGQWAVFSSATAFSFGSTPTLGLWYHLALTCNSADNLRLYVNGVQDATAAYTANTATKFWIGDAYDAGSWLDGWGSAIKIWERVLTIDEINAELPYAMPVNPAALHAAYPLPSEWERMDSGIVIPRGALTRWADVGGLNREWTEAGTLDTDIGPPIRFAPASRIMVRSRCAIAEQPHGTIKSTSIRRGARGGAITSRPPAGIIPGKPRKTIVGKVPIVRPWVGFGWVIRPMIRGALVTGARRLTLRGGVPIVRPWFGFGELARPKVGTAQGAPRKLISGRVPIIRPWMGGAQLIRPMIRGPLVTGAPRLTIRAALLAVRPWLTMPRLFEPVRATTGQASPHATIRAALVIARPWFTAPQIGGPAAAAAPARHVTIRAGLTIARPFPLAPRIFLPAEGARLIPGKTIHAAGVPLRLLTRWYGGAVQAGRAGIIAGKPRKTLLGRVPIVRPWIGTHQLYIQRVGGVTTDFILIRIARIVELTPAVRLTEITPDVAITEITPAVLIATVAPAD